MRAKNINAVYDTVHKFFGVIITVTNFEILIFIVVFDDFPFVIVWDEFFQQ